MLQLRFWPRDINQEQKTIHFYVQVHLLLTNMEKVHEFATTCHSSIQVII